MCTQTPAFQAGGAAFIIARMAQGLLGKLGPTAFLRRHWQKRPLFVRHAVPGCGSWLKREMLFDWATRDHVESRLVMHAGKRWSMQHGPFRPAQLRQLPARGWTLLVQGVEQIHADAAALLQAFSFIPHTRLDDLMVSYAPPGGGVGPHFDSYDVFLLQGMGTRRWRISSQRDMTLVERAPLRILKNFRHTEEWHCTQGDLLYLPPRCAHEGVAMDNCMTLSVGFRAPRKQEVASRFLEYLQDELQLEGMYEDRDLPLQRHAAELSTHTVKKISAILNNLRWNDSDVRNFCGRHLSEPAAQTVFQPPRRPMALSAFSKRIAGNGVRLALQTRLLFSGRDFFINGEHHRVEGAADPCLRQLADRRELTARNLSPSTARLLHTWYRAGYIEV